MSDRTSCQWKSCKRKKKNVHECTSCGHTIRTCSFHLKQTYRQMQEHVIGSHPKIVETALTEPEPQA